MGISKYLFEFNYVICTCNMVWWYIIVHDHPRHVPRVVKSRNQSDLRSWASSATTVCFNCLFVTCGIFGSHFSAFTSCQMATQIEQPCQWWMTTQSVRSFSQDYIYSVRPIPGTRMKIAGCKRLLNREISLVSGSKFKWPSYLEDGWPNHEPQRPRQGDVVLFVTNWLNWSQK